MAGESIEKLHNWDASKMRFPAFFQEKFDGVPVRIRKIGPHIIAVSRQQEPITSIPHIKSWAEHMLADGGSIVGELYIDDMPFKQISGLARKKVPTPETQQLTLRVFDYDITDNPHLSYEVRRQQFENQFKHVMEKFGRDEANSPIKLVPSVTVYDEGTAMQCFDMLMQAKPDAEGAVLHSYEKPFQPGKRVWGTQRIKPWPTIDVLAVDFEEAVQKSTGQGHGRVGRIVVELHTLKRGKLSVERVGVGPGALTHAQAQALWRLYKSGKYKPQIIEVKFMRDDTYDGLRQPTFVRFRSDKTEADVRKV